MTGPFFATVKTEAPFELNNTTVNATERYEQDRRHQHMIAVLKRALITAVIVILICILVIAHKVRTKWPVVTVLLYGVFFVLFLLPEFMGILVWIGSSDADFLDWTDTAEGIVRLFTAPQAVFVWLIYAVLILAQASLLIIPVRTANERPKPRRGIWLTAMVAGFLYSLLLGGVILSLLTAFLGDGWPDCTGWILLGVLPANWILWTVIFRRFANKLDPQSYNRRVMTWLIRGSILELLVAVPSHIIARHRHVCCAHIGTAAGIAAGLAVMFFAFGPGLYYLYKDRINSKKTKPSGPDME